MYQDDPWSDPLIVYNTVNFNNIMFAIFAIFEALTLEGWSIQMFMLQESNLMNAKIAMFFYLILVIFGSYFILNLILAVIMGSFTKFEN
jgi:voltage-dependent calcium channel L type alpha-1D